ncbi:fimbria/pilus periplasmic chaperone [Pseudomonas pseudonitroreducens]|uniref:fimbria/pilus periplasmic chaperone n=1 Tax=Pseudomonas pseudonitroreducens TaxID=2892326 RepID=UPI001F29D54E|nr:fimbria/pilus periplasmic chaperone [Pseudomonas pseudonitroreducens]
MKVSLLSRRVLHAMLLAGCMLAGQAQASIVITGTRVIYPSDQREVTVKLSNDGQSPMLVQSWIDEGNVQATPDASDAPFLLTPPIARIDPAKGQALRVRYTGQKSLAQDKESLFWLNVLEVPPSSDDGQNRLKVAFRSRIKMFYRPASLAGNATAAAEQLQWRLQGSVPEGFNASPYYVSLGKVSLSSGGQSRDVELDINSSLIAPGEHKQLPIKGAALNANGGKVSYSAINDFGGIAEYSQALKP